MKLAMYNDKFYLVENDSMDVAFNIIEQYEDSHFGILAEPKGEYKLVFESFFPHCYYVEVFGETEKVYIYEFTPYWMNYIYRLAKKVNPIVDIYTPIERLVYFANKFEKN